MIEKIYNVLDFGAKADAVTLDTAAVQAAVDACSAAGGGKVYFPKSSYVLATVFLKDNVHIEFENGTVILGALDFYAYAQQEEIDFPLYQDASHSYFNLSMFVGLGCDNISMTGKAYIDNLVLDNVTVETYRPDAREDLVFVHVNEDKI